MRPAGRCVAVLLGLEALLVAGEARAGAFVFAGQANGVDLITHPTGYVGAGGPRDVSVCIDPDSPNALEMVVPAQNVVTRYNELAPITGNLKFGASNDIPSGAIDFESTLLHELGHCLGLAHPNLGSESGLSDPLANHTKSTAGANGTFDVAAGVDGIIGSDDDLRGDDVNLHWFRKSTNDPFGIASIVDAGTYSRNLADLPASHLFAANADRTLATALGVPNTEAVMQQGAFTDEDQRHLAHDDVATLRLAMSGLDEVQGTADDYTLRLTYVGLSSECDVVIGFDDDASAFAVCYTSGFFVAPGHVRISSADIAFNDGFSWFFNETAEQAAPECPAAPSNGCQTGFAKGSVAVVESVPGRERLIAKWLRGPALSAADFGDPTVHPGTTYAACVYDGDGNLAGEYALPRAASACGRRECWRDDVWEGWRYSDSSRSADGIRTLRLQAGAAGSSRLTLIGANDATKQQTALPTGVAAALAGSTSATIQLFASDGSTCFSKTLTDVRKNDGAQFVARS